MAFGYSLNSSLEFLVSKLDTFSRTPGVRMKLAVSSYEKGAAPHISKSRINFLLGYYPIDINC